MDLCDTTAVIFQRLKFLIKAVPRQSYTGHDVVYPLRRSNCSSSKVNQEVSMRWLMQMPISNRIRFGRFHHSESLTNDEKLSGYCVEFHPIGSVKNLHSEILLFSFNPEHDIIVVCSANGDVKNLRFFFFFKRRKNFHFIDRLGHCVSSVYSKSLDIRQSKSTSKTLLSVIFSNRILVLASVQDGHQLLSESLSFETRNSNWIERIQGQQEENVDNDLKSIPIDDYLPVLVDLPAVNRARKHVVDPPDDLFSLDKQNKLNILILFGTNDILLRAFGLWPLLLINRSLLPIDQTLLSVTMSPSLDNLCLLTRGDHSINYSLLECTTFLSDYHNDFLHLTRSLGRIKSLIIFNDKIFTTLVDLTTKCLADFQSRVNNFCQTSRQQGMKFWSLQCELISLLSTGNCSENMQQNFFGNIFDYGYAKKLLATFDETKTKSKELIIMFSRTIEHIFGYLVEIKGLQQWYGKFEHIEFDRNVLETCLSNAGSLLLKINEYTDFIHEMSDVYTFFIRWLVAHQLHICKHNAGTHHDEQIECTEADWDHLIEFLDSYCAADEPPLDIFSMYLKSENLPEALIRDSVYRKLMDHGSHPKNSCFSAKPKRTLLGAYQDLKQSINKAFEVRTQSNNHQMSKPLSLLASISLDPQSTTNVDFDHRRNQHSIYYLIQHHALQFHLLTFVSATKQSHVRLIDLQYILGPHRSVKRKICSTNEISFDFRFSSIGNFKLYDDNKLALVCSYIVDNQQSSSSDSISMNNNHPSHLIMINFKSTVDDLPAHAHTNLSLLQTLKDVPAKLTVDGRRNLIAVVSLTTNIFFPLSLSPFVSIEIMVDQKGENDDELFSRNN
uniref:Anaphase-promoting complex subunit 4 n=1 Tax=Philodina roseola TaxID=96448 RepID=B6S341_PHIRO|nr:hypothetical protein [Philodina roseola]